VTPSVVDSYSDTGRQASEGSVSDTCRPASKEREKGDEKCDGVVRNRFGTAGLPVSHINL
jgi:hypothetical protein